MKRRWLWSLIISLFLFTVVSASLPINSAQAARSWSTFQRDDSGETVRSIQYMLRQHGYNLPPNGIFGPKTTAAVKRFQSMHELSADGVVDSQTWEALIVVSQEGDSGNVVRALQRQLNAHGANLEVDGVFTSETKGAVTQFQQQHKLVADGVASLDLWNRLVTPLPSTPVETKEVSPTPVASPEEQKPSVPEKSNEPFTVLQKPTISASFINQVLAHYNSPARGKGEALYALGEEYGIDPAFALAFFQHESSFGKYGRANADKSLGNIRCSTPKSTYVCNDGFRKYKSWEAGFEDWYRLIGDLYVQQWKLKTVDQIVPVYAPSIENDVDTYVRTVKRSIQAWRAGRMA